MSNLESLSQEMTKLIEEYNKYQQEEREINSRSCTVRNQMSDIKKKIHTLNQRMNELLKPILGKDNQ